MTTRDIGLATAVAVVWGVNFVFIHIGLETFPPLLFAALRFALTAFPAVLFIRPPRVPVRWILAVGLTLSTGQFAFLFTGMHLGMPAGLASVTLQVQAVFTIGLAVAFLGERLDRRRMAGAAVAVIGLVILAVGRAESVPLVAVLCVVAAAASWAVGNILVRQARASDPFALLVWSSLVGPLPLLGLSLVIDGPEVIAASAGSLDLAALVALAYVVVVSTFFGYGIWTRLLHRYPASHVVPFTLLVPAVGVLAAWVALGERPTASELLGGVIIVAGLVLTVGIGLRRPAGQADTPATEAQVELSP
jgi:O-acetylserine/cysteine efflux transporter